LVKNIVNFVKIDSQTFFLNLIYLLLMQNYIAKKTQVHILHVFSSKNKSKTTNVSPFSTFISTKRADVIIC